MRVSENEILQRRPEYGKYHHRDLCRVLRQKLHSTIIGTPVGITMRLYFVTELRYTMLLNTMAGTTTGPPIRKWRP